MPIYLYLSIALRPPPCFPVLYLCISSYLKCWISEMPPNVAVSLFNHWRIPSAISPERMQSELSSRMRVDRTSMQLFAPLSIQIVLPSTPRPSLWILFADVLECSGRDHIVYRNHYHFTRVNPLCRDQCYEPETNQLTGPYMYTISYNRLISHSSSPL